MTYKREAFSFIVYFGLFIGCSENGERFTSETARLTANADPNPGDLVHAERAGGRAQSRQRACLGRDVRAAREPAISPTGRGSPTSTATDYSTSMTSITGRPAITRASGSITAQGAFGQNLYSVAVAPAHNDSVITGLSNEMQLVADFNGDGKVDMYLLGWSGRGALCINQGTAAHADWTGPSFICYQAWAAKNFADVNGDGRIDVEIVDPSTPYDPYKDDCRTLPLSWRLNNGNPDPNTWPSDSNYFHFVGVAAPGALIDFNNDGLPDTIHGIEATPDQRGPYLIQSAGLQVSLGQPDGTYRPVTSGLEGVLQPAVAFTDIDEDGCIDVGTDETGYRDNQTWYVQDRSGTTCLATFHPVARTALPYDPGFRHYTVDVDNDGLLDRVIIAHIGYGSDGLAGGIHVFRRQPGGGYQDLGAAGTNINGTNVTEFYADQLSIDDWNGDGKLDIAGAGQASIPGTDEGIALWTSNLTTTNNWLKVRTADITGFFAGAATIEVFDAGFSGDTSHYVTPPKVLRTGQAWAGKLYHFGVGTRATVDLRVTLPNGTQNLEINGRDQPDDRRGRRGGRWRRHPLDGGRRGTGRHAGAATAGYASPVATTPAATHSHARASDNAHVRSRERRDAPGAARDGDRHLPASAARWRPERGHRRVGRCDRARHLGGGQQRQRLRARRRPGHDGQRRLAIDLLRQEHCRRGRWKRRDGDIQSSGRVPRHPDPRIPRRRHRRPARRRGFGHRQHLEQRERDRHHDQRDRSAGRREHGVDLDHRRGRRPLLPHDHDARWRHRRGPGGHRDRPVHRRGAAVGRGPVGHAGGGLPRRDGDFASALTLSRRRRVQNPPGAIAGGTHFAR